MKNTFKKFEGKKINKPSQVKGGAVGRGTRTTASQASNKAELL